MKFSCIFLLLVALHQAAAIEFVNLVLEFVDHVHNDKKCEVGTFPRVIHQASCDGSDPNKLFKAKCLSCVPEGVDAVCNRQGYLRAYLSSKMSPFNCHMYSTEVVPSSDRVYCPLGTTCISNPDSPSLGVCCYGKMTASDGATNGDKVCSKCETECDSSTESCQEDVDKCGKLVYKCKGHVVAPEKEGFCAPIGNYRPKNYCRHDGDCGTYEKCCTDGEDECGEPKPKVCSGIYIS